MVLRSADVCCIQLDNELTDCPLPAFQLITLLPSRCRDATEEVQEDKWIPEHPERDHLAAITHRTPRAERLKDTKTGLRACVVYRAWMATQSRSPNLLALPCAAKARTSLQTVRP